MTPPHWKPWPNRAKEVTAIAVAEITCRKCGATAGQPCTDPGEDREVHGSRWATAAMVRRRRRQAARLTEEQQAALASLPRVPPEEIEKCRLPNGGYRFDQATLERWGVPWPPPAGWRKAVERAEP
ncbi:MAG TPA: hypothetical protein VFB06_29550 [Streptosporangiaceae bacterium]|nr:hypothetical protein [Streptosporangiaceae bacterium]